MNISTRYMTFYIDNHKIQVWVEIQNNEYILYWRSDGEYVLREVE